MNKEGDYNVQKKYYRFQGSLNQKNIILEELEKFLVEIYKKSRKYGCKSLPIV